MSSPNNGTKIIIIGPGVPSGTTPVGTTGISATQVAYGSAANTIKGTTGFTFIEGTGAFAIPGNLTVSGTGTSSIAGNTSIAATAASLGVTARLRVDSPNTNTGPAIAGVADSIGRAVNLYEAGYISGTSGVLMQFNAVTGSGFSVGVGTNGGNNGGVLQFLASTNLSLGAKISSYNGIATAGWGIPAIQNATRVTAQSAAGTIGAYTVGAADGSFRVSANMNVTASTALTTTITCTYTDESNTSRTMVLPVAPLSGTFATAGAITGAGASVWETPAMHIRCKASTAITIATTAGTFTGVTFTAECNIQQIA